MPCAVVKTLSEQTNKPIHVVEGLWRKAKRFAANEGEKGNYLMVLEATRRMLGLTEHMKKVSMGQKVRWTTVTGDTLTGTVHGTLPDCCMIQVENPSTAPSMDAILRQRSGIVVVPLTDVVIL